MTTHKAKFCLPATKRHLSHLCQYVHPSRLPASKNKGSQATGDTPGTLTPRQIRSFQVHLARIHHIADQTAKAYLDQVRRVGGPPMTMLSADPVKALQSSKHLAVLLSIAKFVSENDIPLNHWFRSQFDLLKPPSRCLVVPVNLCHGENAFLRYQDWARRQSSRYTHKADRTKALDSSFRATVQEAVRASHQFALEQLSNSAVPLFSVEFALWDMFPNVSPWYLVAHPGFRAEFLETSACLAPSVVERFQQYKRDPVIRRMCDQAFLAVTDNLGDLPCIQSHSEQA